MKNEKKIVEMINKFQCPGCVYGEDTESCSEFNIVYKSCGKHVIGTSLFPGGSFMLAMPKGFNKAGVDIYGNSFNKVNIDFCADTDEILNDYLNVPMWIPYLVIPIAFLTASYRILDKTIELIKTPAEKVVTKTEHEMIIEEM